MVFNVTKGFTQQPPRYQFEVFFKDGHSEKIHSRIWYDKTTGENYLLGEGDHPILPASTDSVFRIIKGDTKIKGVPFPKTWLFSVIQGNISCFSYVPENSSESINANLKREFLLKKGDLSLTRYSDKEFQTIIADKPAVLQYYHRLSTTNKVFFTAFLTGLIGGFTLAVASQNQNVVLTGVLIATVIPLGSFIPLMCTRKSAVKSIYKYNSDNN
jgi:hypothetical protein